MPKAKKKKTVRKSKPTENGKLCAILAYLFVGIIWYFVDDKVKKDKFAKFHVKQSIVLLIASLIFNVVYSILYSIVSAVLVWIPVIGWLIMLILALGFVLPVVWFIIGIVNAASCTEDELPIIGHFGEKLSF